jgi:hypothetical protein
MSAGQLFYDAFPRPLSSTGLTMPLGYYNFYLSGTTSAAPVYQDAALTTPYPAQTLPPGGAGTPNYSVVVGDSTGTMQPIFLNPNLIYRVQLYNAAGQLIEDVDPYIPALPGFGNGPISLNAQGEVTVAPPTSGGTGISLTIFPRTGAQALRLVGITAGNSILTINNAVTVGANTATFSATNKPGSATTAPTKWLPITCDGVVYYLPLWT